MDTYIICIVLAVIQAVNSSQILSVIKEVDHCFDGDLEPCLVNHAVDAIVDAAGLQDVVNQTNGERSFGLSVEEKLARKLESSLFGTSDTQQTIRGRGVLRTYNKAWKYLLPLLLGAKLSLATFVPIVLTFLTFLAKTAFLSGNMALLLTALNIALKYWYPKWSAEKHHEQPSDHSYLSNFHNYEGFPSNLQSSFQGHGYGQNHFESIKGQTNGKIPSGEYDRIMV